MDSRSVRYICLLATLVSLLNCGPLLGANSQQGDTPVQEAMAATQTENQRPPGGTSGASTAGAAGAAAAAAVEETQTKAAQAEAEASTGGAAAAAAQNPFSSITAVFIQQDTNLKIGPNGRVEGDVHLLPIIPTRLGAHWTLTTMVNVPLTYQPILTSNTSGVAGLGDVPAHLLLLASYPPRCDVGDWPGLQSTHGHKCSSQHGEIQRRPSHGAPVAAWKLDAWYSDELSVLGGGTFRKEQCEPGKSILLHQLQPAKGLVPDHNRRAHGRLDTAPWERVENSVWRRSWTGSEAGIATRERNGPFPCECRA